jgi:hypothetical protein
MTSHKMMPAITFGSMPESEHRFYILFSFLAQITRRQMQRLIQVEGTKANRVMYTQ